jgi:hypothetical protein
MAFFALVGATLAAGLLETAVPASFDVTVRLAGPDTVIFVRASKCAPLLLFCHRSEKKRPQR